MHGGLCNWPPLKPSRLGVSSRYPAMRLPRARHIALSAAVIAVATSGITLASAATTPPGVTVPVPTVSGMPTMPPVPAVIPNPTVPDEPNVRVPIPGATVPGLNTPVLGFQQPAGSHADGSACTEEKPCVYVAHLTPAGNPIDQGSNITATITYKDFGDRWTAHGTGTGFAATKSYLTLTYGTGSATAGPAACLWMPDESFDQMQVGQWEPVGSANRTLDAARVGPGYFPIAIADSTSVRRIDQIGLTDSIPLQACGDPQQVK
jgi:hypothetical protein